MKKFKLVSLGIASLGAMAGTTVAITSCGSTNKQVKPQNISDEILGPGLTPSKPVDLSVASVDVTTQHENVANLFAKVFGALPQNPTQDQIKKAMEDFSTQGKTDLDFVRKGVTDLLTSAKMDSDIIKKVSVDFTNVNITMHGQTLPLPGSAIQEVSITDLITNDINPILSTSGQAKFAKVENGEQLVNLFMTNDFDMTKDVNKDSDAFSQAVVLAKLFGLDMVKTQVTMQQLIAIQLINASAFLPSQM